jgi:hypothetical protein
MSADYDSPWKEALDVFFESFLALLFPAAHAQIDWSRGWEALDKEFQQIVREAEMGRRYVDKLAKVWTKAGAECWVLVHVEVQTDRDLEFPLRMHVYHYRIFDRYNKPVASLAVLADDDPGWRPREFHESLFGCESILRFPTAKLLDFAVRDDELEASENPFAKVVLAHLKARQTKDNPGDRRSWKIRLVRGLYERGFSAKDVRELFRVIDWLMELPPPLDNEFWDDVDKIQQEGRMPFITTPERVGVERGLRKGIEVLLKLRFGEEGLKLMPEIRQIYGEEQLETILNAIGATNSIEEASRLWSSEDKQ